MKKFLVSGAIFAVALWAVPYWEHEDFEKAEFLPRGKAVLQADIRFLRGDWQTWSYIHELVQTAGFVASMQVADSLNPEFGGVIEGEDQMGVVETDNTQQAVWVWTRYYEITGDTTYFLNVRRAWIYIMNHPAYSEEGTDSDYYRVWNCGLALFGETKYRIISNDSTYLWYSDSCAKYILYHPLPFNISDPYYRRLHPKVTSLAAGMLYQYGKEMSNQIYRDSAIAYGFRVKNWIEQDPNVNINDEIWAMSGGTAVWGLCRSIFDSDTTLGQSWLNTYLPYMKYYQPTGTWNNSWNIWYANAYNFSGRILQNGTYSIYHHSLTDSMLIQDYDDDGGIPPTRSWNQYQDHSWVSNYMVFMGFEGLMDSIKDFDAGVRYLYACGPRNFFLVGDSLRLFVVAGNYGFEPISNVGISISSLYYNADTIVNFAIGEEDTIWFSEIWVANDTANFIFSGVCYHSADQRFSNDTVLNSIYVRPLRSVSGTVRDSILNTGIEARIFFQFVDDTIGVFFDSTQTDSNTGDFTVQLIDSIYDVYVYTEIPYPDLDRNPIYVTPDSFSDLNFYTSSADLLIINRDSLGRYSEYYAKPLDSLSITYKVWKPVQQGIFPISRISEFRNNIIVWFTGKNRTNNVTPAEQESLIVFLNSGGRLLISGQNIGEDISQTGFFQNYLHARLLDDSIFAIRCYADQADSLGSRIGKFQTTGSSGAQNQYSRDLIAGDSVANEFLFYDSLQTNCAGIWFNNFLPNYKIIYLGFGLEAVNKMPWSGYVSRKYVLQQFLNWFSLTGIEENLVRNSQLSDFFVFPDPCNTHLMIQYGFRFPIKEKAVELKIYDAAGRLVRNLEVFEPRNNLSDIFVWDLTDDNRNPVSNGVYFVQLKAGNITRNSKIVVVR
ncbi:MAG: T9SS type A sorting domain-containing protein [candidate division WOR-3 bacterium]